MKSLLNTAVTIVMALPLVAQTPAPAKPGQKPVAVINGEVITQAKLDFLYERIGTQARAQYEKVGGKKVFLDNYIGKRLIVQEAIKSGFDKNADVQADVAAAAESVVFDRYVRDVLSGAFITEAELKKYYNENPKDFEIPEKVKVRHIIITSGPSGPRPKERSQALEMMSGILAELRTKIGATPNSRIALSRFAEAAAKYSEDSSGVSGGDLGWQTRGSLEPTFEEAAFALQPGVISGIIETPYGFHLIFVEEKKPASTEPFESAKSSIREFLITQNAAKVMDSVKELQTELRKTSTVSVYPENIN